LKNINETKRMRKIGNLIEKYLIDNELNNNNNKIENNNDIENNNNELNNNSENNHNNNIEKINFWAMVTIKESINYKQSKKKLLKLLKL
jgi:hypothetical protein